MGDENFCPPVVPRPPDHLDYNMNHKHRGICLILSTENFAPDGKTRNLKPRLGADKDNENIVRLFQHLDFQIILHKDLTGEQVKQTLNQVAQMDHSNSDCFVCFVLSHGDFGHIYAYDTRYATHVLFNFFTGDNCPTLAGKPKLFFIQACQGELCDPGVLVKKEDAFDTVSYFKIPSHSDIMIAFSSVPGYYSYRNNEKGSWFVAALTEVFAEYHAKYDALTMMTIVCQRVAYNYSSNTLDANLMGMKQTPHIVTMLTRRLFLQPKVLTQL